mgnify:CR=1 FL=1
MCTDCNAKIDVIDNQSPSAVPSCYTDALNDVDSFGVYGDEISDRHVVELTSLCQFIDDCSRSGGGRLRCQIGLPWRMNFETKMVPRRDQQQPPPRRACISHYR